LFVIYIEIEPAFPYRDVTIRRDTAIREAYEFLDEIGRSADEKYNKE